VGFRVCTSLVLRIQLMWGLQCAHRWCCGFRSCGLGGLHSAGVEDSGNVDCYSEYCDEYQEVFFPTFRKKLLPSSSVVEDP
jgi:hypothetical protein